ncbi:hypothetical protein ACFLUE_02080 [Chloroflexota bacterium]
MRWVMRIFISVCVLGLVGLGGYVVYNMAYGSGEVTGYSQGYAAGEQVGYGSGETAGYDLGYEQGSEVGYDDGYASGKAGGYEEGYVGGHEEGYLSGDADGYEEGVLESIGHGYNLKDPTYAEAVTFLREDKTDENEYDEDSYVCSHFVRDICNNADQAGLRCALVELRYTNMGHVIVAFDTIDRGLMFFEPQYDDRVYLAVGESYSGLNGYINEGDDDIIQDILVIW